MPDIFNLPNTGFGNNNLSVGGGISAANSAVNTATPRAQAPNPVLPPLAFGQTGSATTSAQTGTSAEMTAGTRRAVLPENWLGTANSGMGELLGEYATARDAYDTTAYDEANKSQQERDLAVGMAAANNAAADYTARSRQSGASGGGAGLVKAQGIIMAQDQAGKAEVERAKFDMEQREAAATHAGQIATLLGNLRTSYLGALIGQDTTGSGANATASSGSQLSIQGKGGADGGAGYGSNIYVPTQGPLTTTSANPSAPRPGQSVVSALPWG